MSSIKIYLLPLHCGIDRSNLGTRQYWDLTFQCKTDSWGESPKATSSEGKKTKNQKSPERCGHVFILSLEDLSFRNVKLQRRNTVFMPPAFLVKKPFNVAGKPQSELLTSPLLRLPPSFLESELSGVGIALSLSAPVYMALSSSPSHCQLGSLTEKLR